MSASSKTFNFNFAWCVNSLVSWKRMNTYANVLYMYVSTV